MKLLKVKLHLTTKAVSTVFAVSQKRKRLSETSSARQLLFGFFNRTAQLKPPVQNFTN